MHREGFESVRTGRIVDGRRILSEVEYKHVSAHQGLDGGVCKVLLNGDRFIKDSCVAIDRNINLLARTSVDGRTSTDPEEGRESYMRAEFVGVEGALQDDFYSKGRLMVTVDDWQGEVIYREGQTPRWIMSNGSYSEFGSLMATPK